MWILTSKKTGDLFFLLPEKKSYTVGRTGTDLILKDDTSISRTHAQICPYENYVKVFDTGSKYGCFCNHNIDNNVRMPKDSPVILKNGERIRFGVLNNEWIVSELHIVTMTSSLPNDKKQILSEQMEALNGQIVDEWTPNCTHLTMSEITVTVKVLYALVEQIPIVPCDYWSAYLDNVRKGKSPPKPEQFSPKLSESFIDKNLVNFEVNKNRRHLFDGKIFVFMGRHQMLKYGPIVTKSGATYKELNTGVQKKFLLQKNCIVVQNTCSSSQSQNSQTIISVNEFLESNGKRLIPEYEIGLAIILCSLEKHCNPYYKVLAEILPACKSTEPNDFNTILAEESEEKNIENYLQEMQHVEIPETAGVSEIQKCSNMNDEQNNITAIPIECSSQPYINIPENNIYQSNVTSEECVVPGSTNTVKNSIKNTKRKAECLEANVKNAKRIHVEVEAQSEKELGGILVNTKDFLDKSQIKISQIVEKSKDKNTNIQDIRKRGRLAILDDDENEDDIFNFGSVKKPKTDLIESDDGEEPYETSNQSEVVLVKDQPIKKKTENIAQPKPPAPIKITPSGWISTTSSKSYIKPELNTSNNEFEDLEDTKNTNTSVESGFTVCVKPMSLVSKLKNTSLNSEDSDKTPLVNNFKKFVKKQNYMPQTKTVTTVPVPICRK